MTELSQAEPVAAAEIDAAVQAEQVRLIYRSRYIVLINLVNAALATALLWRIYPMWVVATWCALFLLVIPARIALVEWFHRVQPEPSRLKRWGHAFAFGAGVTGALWGLLGTAPFLTNQSDTIVFAAFLVGGMTAGSLIRDSAYLPAFHSYAGPALIPVIAGLLLKDGIVFQTMGLLLGAFGVVLLVMARHNNGWIVENLRLKLDQANLAKDLGKTTADLVATVEVLQQHQQDATAVARLSDILQACENRGEAYPIIARTARKLFTDASGALSLVIGGESELVTVARWGDEQPTPVKFLFKDCWGLRTGRRYQLTPGGDGNPCLHFKEPPVGGYICLPLTVQGETTGLLHLSVPEGQAVSEDLSQLLMSFGEVVKLSLSNLGLRERLSEQVMRDPLTSLFNRRYLTETLPREIGRAGRDGTALSLAMLDIDHFKSLNDTFGHTAGDLVLKELGGLLQISLRGGDIACRYGGEEFLLVLPNCNLVEAEARMKEIAALVKSKTFTEGNHTLPPITLSIGVAQLSEDLPTSDALIAAADESLYAAKRNGRDRTEIFVRKPRKRIIANASEVFNARRPA